MKRCAALPLDGCQRTSELALSRFAGHAPLAPAWHARSAEIAQAAVEAGITPIEVMLTAMRDLWEHGTPEGKREAAIIARHAAPYVHPRLASIDQTINEPQRFVIHAPLPLSVEEWKAKVKADGYGPAD